ncbi:MAG: ABC transporter permease [Vicinamibacterales bacterium]
MRPLLAIAVKDLRLLPRVRMGFFFTFIWPLVVSVMFGFAFGGPAGGATNAIAVALVDEDASAASQAFAERLRNTGNLDLSSLSRPEAEAAVRRGQLAAFLVLERGFGAASARMFYGAPRRVSVGTDPARKAEAGMLEGLLMQAAAADMQQALSNPERSSAMVDQALQSLGTAPAADAELEHFLRELKTFVGSPASQAQSGGGMNWQPLEVVTVPVARERRGPANSFEVTFPQGVLWGLIGCVMSFGLALVGERTHGTLLRLGIAPLTRWQILGGKALACFAAMLLVQALLYLLGYTLFGVRPASWPLLALASVTASIAFCGFMMLVATLGDTEQAASGTAWAIMMPLAMVGGAMIPQFVMPAWMAAIGNVSPIKWALLAIEGAIWRDFTLGEMVLPCTILVAVGLACFALGTRRLRIG